jgi:hypothetical protein
MTAAYQQRKRTRGWRTPENSICCTRPGRWGNPYRVARCGNVNDRNSCRLWVVANGDTQCTDCTTRESATKEAVGRYAVDLQHGRLSVTLDDVRRELDGKILLCWCPVGSVCHVQDVLIPIVNGLAP